jgi:TPR repeat protein
MSRTTAFTLAFAALAVVAPPVPADEDAFDKAIHTYGCADYPKAFGMIVPLAKGGHALAQYQMGLMLEQGQGTPADLAEAYKWYQKAADQGIADAYFALGQIYYRGVVVPKDMTQAMISFDVAARLGHAVSGDWRGMVSNTLNEEQLAKAQKAATELVTKRPAGALDRIR